MATTRIDTKLGAQWVSTHWFLTGTREPRVCLTVMCLDGTEQDITFTAAQAKALAESLQTDADESIKVMLG